MAIVYKCSQSEASSRLDGSASRRLSVRLPLLLAGASLATLSTGAMGQSTTPASTSAAQAAEAAPQDTTVETPPAAPAAETNAADVVVTGSRIVRNGFQAPTPVTVVTTEDLVKGAPGNIADGLNQLPQFQGSRSTAGAPGETLTNANQPRAGNYLNLRNVGSQRMLVLLDGRRVPPTSFEGTVDINTLPQGLVQRVDVVTAGASAVYGADAVSGVVNFVLNTRFKGLRGTLQSGISEEGDAHNYRLSISGGIGFAGDRGHIVANYDQFYNEGLQRKDQRRYLTDPVYYLAGTRTAADPFRNTQNARNISYTEGGLITAAQTATGAGNPRAASLISQQFLDSQTIAPLQFGAATGNSTVRIGGQGAIGAPEAVGAASLRTQQGFAHASYELGDSVTAFVQGSYAVGKNRYNANFDSRSGANAFRIYSGNPYIPGTLQATLNQTDTASFTLARQLKDFPIYAADTRTRSWMTTGGLQGSLPFLASSKWEVYYTHGDAQLNTSQVQNQNRNLFAAVDAVRNSAGQIVCRVTVTNPGLLPGCVPVNLFGSGSPSAEALAFISGRTEFEVVNKLDEWAGNFGGAPFSTWAGPVAFNIGLNYRKQSLKETSNGDPAIPVNYTGIRGVPGTAGLPGSLPATFSFTNVGVASGRYTVREANAEAAVPLLKDLPLVRSLEINGAGRYTDYSTSGTVWTWKAGLSWEVFEGLRVRATRSKDIRAPTLYDLFAGRQINPISFTDTGVTNQTQNTVSVSGGNPDLQPEVGYTTAIGAVFQPTFLPGFSVSVDYYDLKIKGAISTVASNTALIQCVASGGTDALCDLFVRAGPITNTSPANFPTQFLAFPINIASLRTSGIDVDMSYRKRLSDFSDSLPGAIGVRALVNYIDRFQTNNGAGARTLELAGLVNRSRWRTTVSVNYDSDGLGLFLQARTIGAARRDTPGNTGQIYVQNKVPAQTYLDFTIDNRIVVGNRRVTPFLTVNNLLDKKALILPSTFVPGALYPTEPATYDIFGRRFTAGIRFDL